MFLVLKNKKNYTKAFMRRTQIFVTLGCSFNIPKFMEKTICLLAFFIQIIGFYKLFYLKLVIKMANPTLRLYYKIITTDPQYQHANSNNENMYLKHYVYIYIYNFSYSIFFCFSNININFMFFFIIIDMLTRPFIFLTIMNNPNFVYLQ